MDGFLIRNLKQLPTWANDWDNLHPLAQQFIAVLSGSVPSMDEIAVNVQYQQERAQIEQKDWREEIDFDKIEILNMLAKQRGLTTDEFVAQKTQQLQKEALEELDIKYGIKPPKKPSKLEKLREFQRAKAAAEKPKDENEVDPQIRNLLKWPDTKSTSTSSKQEQGAPPDLDLQGALEEPASLHEFLSANASKRTD